MIRTDKIIKIGDRFGRLTVVSGPHSGEVIKYDVKCDCGVEKKVSKYSLLTGHTKSCGCLKRDKILERNITHGLSDTPEYRIWRAIKTRCYDKNSQYYYAYGGRGITVCDRWLESFENFIEDMGMRPGANYSIDRIDNDKGYSPDNCRWADTKTQSINKSNNRLLTYKGETLTLSQWAEKLGIDRTTIWSRINRGYSVEEALSTPLKTPSLIEYNGKSLTAHKWAIITGINANTIKYRLSRGWKLEDVFSKAKSKGEL